MEFLGKGIGFLIGSAVKGYCIGLGIGFGIVLAVRLLGPI